MKTFALLFLGGFAILYIVVRMGIYLAQSAAKRWVMLAALCGIISAALALYNALPWAYCAAGIATEILAIVLAFKCPVRRDRIMRYGYDLGNITLPPIMLEAQSRRGPTMNVMQDVFDMIKERQVFDFPPDGYWSTRFADPMILGQLHVVRLNMGPLVDVSPDDSWLEEESTILTSEDRGMVFLAVPRSQSFEMLPERIEGIIDVQRGANIGFAFAAKHNGRCSVRLDIFLNDRHIGWLQEKITVRRRGLVGLALLAAVIGSVVTAATVLAILKVM